MAQPTSFRFPQPSQQPGEKAGPFIEAAWENVFEQPNLSREIKCPDRWMFAPTDADCKKLGPGEVFVWREPQVFIQSVRRSLEPVSEARHESFEHRWQDSEGNECHQAFTADSGLVRVRHFVSGRMIEDVHKLFCELLLPDEQGTNCCRIITAEPDGRVRVRDFVCHVAVVRERPYHGARLRIPAGTSVEVSGSEVFEAFSNAACPEAYKSDVLLWRAKREAKRAKATHLTDAALRAVAWAAFLPEHNACATLSALMKTSNQFANAYLDVLEHEPSTVARLLNRIRERRDRKRLKEIDAALNKWVQIGKYPMKGRKDEPIKERRKSNRERKRVADARGLTKPSREMRELGEVLSRMPGLK